MAQAVVGLGNPGPRYRGTRHSVGHQVLDRLADRLRAEQALLVPFSPVSRLGQFAVARWADELLYLFKPASFMNSSGPSVGRFARRHALAPTELILVYDDIDLPPGKVRVRLKGSSGGHRGVQSIIEHLGTQALRRLKVGIGRPGFRDGVVDYVLSRFTEKERPLIDAACDLAAEEILKLVAARALRHEGRE